jgi:hypothetical protein
MKMYVFVVQACFNDYVYGLHCIVLVNNMICEEWFGKHLERGCHGLKQSIVG